MNITIWGCRGSLPVPGQNTLKYGGNTTCIEVRLNNGNLIIIDAGSGIRNLGSKIIQEKELKEMFLFFTHAHWDHLNGLPFFGPAYIPKYTVKVRGGPSAKRSLKKYMTHQMDPPFFPVSFDAMKASFEFTQNPPKKKVINDTEILPIPLSHPNGGYGFKFIEKGKTFVFLTDNELDFIHEGGLTFDEYAAFSKDADLLIHDAQYSPEEYKTKKMWGHSSYTTVLKLAAKAGVKQLVLFHHDPDHSDIDLDNMLIDINTIIEKEQYSFQCTMAFEGQTFIL